MKYILVQFQRDKGKEFAGKYYIYKYDENKIKDSFVPGDVINELINSSEYLYSNAAIIIQIFNNYEEYLEFCDSTAEIAFDDNEIKVLTHISLFKRRLRVGDKVKIHKPKDISEWPTWISGMDTFNDKIGTVTAVMFFNFNEYYCHIDYKSWAFNINWLEKVEDDVASVIDNPELSVSTSCDGSSYSPSDLNLKCTIQDYISESQEKTTENKESEGNKMDFSNILNVEFGKINDSHDVAASMYGIAIRGNDNRYRAYDKANGKIIDVTGMTFNTDMLFKIPCAISQISVGDVIINAGNYVTVTNVHKDGTFTVVDPKASEQKIAIPAKNMFGFDFMTKVFYPLDSFIKPTDDNPFGLNPMAMMLLASDEDTDMSTLVLMTMMGNGTINQNMMLPMILTMNKNEHSSDMGTLALAMMMGQTNAFDMSNRRKCTYKHHDASKEEESYRRALETSPVPEPIYDDTSDVPDAINPCVD